MPGKESLEKMRAALQLVRVEVMRSMNPEMMAATTTATTVSAAGGCVARGCDQCNRQHGDRKGGNHQPSSSGRTKALWHAVD